jgi:hypothetical protein
MKTSENDSNSDSEERVEEVKLSDASGQLQKEDQPKRGPIHKYKKRKHWYDSLPLNKNKQKPIIWAFYNSGRQVFYDGQNLPPTTYYDKLWIHLPFQRYRNPQTHVMSEDGKHLFVVQTLGHDKNMFVRLIVGCTSKPISIPPGHILYVARGDSCSVKGKLLQRQVLPFRTVIPPVWLPWYKPNKTNSTEIQVK